MHKKIFTRLGLLFFLALPCHATSSYAADEVPPPPSIENDQPVASQGAPVPPIDGNDGDDSRNIPQPEVRIIKKKDATIEEYRINGKVRYVKIIPSSGRPYYMVDTDGDGRLDKRENDLDNPPINRWILLEW